jgi:hypothetical protein
MSLYLQPAPATLRPQRDCSTLLNETGYLPDVIELQLAHQERHEVRAAYNRAWRLEERRR